MTQVRRTSHAVYHIYYHFVWVPKYRKGILKGEVGKELSEILYRMAKEYDWWISEMQIMEDHVHVFLSAPPRYAPAEIIQNMKGISSRELFKKFPELKEELWAGEFWSDGYYVGTAGDKVTVDLIRKYIRHQSQLRLKW